MSKLKNFKPPPLKVVEPKSKTCLNAFWSANPELWMEVVSIANDAALKREYIALPWEFL